jgi:hypothetical protein
MSLTLPIKKNVLTFLVVIGLIGSASASILTGSLTNGLLAYYEFSGSGYDSSGNQRNLSIYNSSYINAPQFESQLGQSLQQSANGVNYSSRGDYNNTPGSDYANDNNVLKTTEFTISFLINPTTTTRSSPHEWFYLFGGGDSTGNGVFLRIGVDQNRDVHFGSTLYYTSTSMNQLSENSWQLLTVTASGSNIGIYYNKQLISSSTNATPISLFKDHYTIGNDGWVNIYPFEGQMDNVGIWNRALSASEVSQLAIPEPSTFALFGLGAFGLLIVMCRKKTA